MFDEYLAEILAVYEKKKDEASLSTNLTHPTPANLGKECINVYRLRYINSDDNTLTSFFGPPDREKGYAKIIENFRADDFRQIPKILNGKTTNPGIRFIELLAWLIDFQPRPSILYYKLLKENKTTGSLEDSNVDIEKTDQPNDQETQVPDNTIIEEEDKPIITNGVNTTENNEQDSIGQSSAQDNTNEDQDPKPPGSTKTIIIISLIFLLIGTGTFFFWEYKPNIGSSTVPLGKGCMYWAGDHYETIDCNEKVSGVPVVPLNMKVLKNLKKINLPDTLTKSSLGKVWYKGRGTEEHEFFTDSGMHPVDTVKRLKPITSYTLANHVSYYRYLLTLVVSLIGAVILFVFFAILITYLRKKHKNRVPH